MESSTAVQLPKVAIRFCVQCKWNLRAAYYAQELLQTFSNTLGEISLIPVTGGVFTINLYHSTPTSPEFQADVIDTLIWDRKRDGGFPETKELKNRVRNVVDPQKDMGHVDRALKKGQDQGQEKEKAEGEAGSADAEKAPKTAEAGTTEAYDQLAGHAGHKKADGPPKDCEECVTAAREADPSNERF